MNKEFVARRGVISLGGLTFPYYSTDSNYTASTDDYFIDITTSGVTVELPSSSGITGKQYAIRNTSTGNTTIDAYSGQTIEGDLTVTLGVGNTLQLVSDNSNWKILNVGGPIRTATNNSLLTSDGTIGGVDANTGLTFDGQTLRNMVPQTSGSTYIESYAYQTEFTATTASTIVFSYPLQNTVMIEADLQWERTIPNYGLRANSGRCVRYSGDTGLKNITVTNVIGGTSNNAITFSSSTDSENMYFIYRAPSNPEFGKATINVKAIKI